MGFSSKFVATCAAGLILSGAAFAQDTAATQETMAKKEMADQNEVLATVNGKDITLGHVLSLASRLPAEYMNVPDADLYNGIVDQLVQQELLSSLVNEESLELKLARENELRALLANEAVQGVYNEASNEEAVMAQYNELYVNADPIPEYNTSHILVETEEEAKELITTLEGGKDFAELAKEKSTGPSGPQGGLLGWIGLGQTVPEFEEAMLKLEVGKTSVPVKSQFGWHVLLLNETRDQPVPELATVREQIEKGLQSAALEETISKLETSAKIERLQDKFDPSLVKKFELIQK